MIIISGGQTGADIAGLKVAKQLNFKTGGFAAKNFMTENGTAELKKIAKYITKSNQESGVAHAIREWVLD
jgi:hydroxymethylpyrimidine pyrophosphatase-like HAD family hydrolase